VLRSLQPSATLDARSVEDSLPTPEIRLHITIEVIGRLCLAQAMRPLYNEELSLADFLLDQISLLKEVVAQQGGEVPLIVAKLLGNMQIALPSDLPPITSHRWYARFANRVMPNPALTTFLVVGLIVLLSATLVG
jgi:hypothetical protein